MFEYWKSVYETDLENLYGIYLEEHSKNTELFRRVIPYAIFCEIVYYQSKQRIPTYERMDQDEIEE